VQNLTISWLLGAIEGVVVVAVGGPEPSEGALIRLPDGALESAEERAQFRFPTSPNLPLAWQEARHF